MTGIRRIFSASVAATIVVALFTVPAAAAEPFELVNDAYQTPVGQELVVAAPGFIENDTIPSSVYGFQDSADAPDHGDIDLGDNGAFTYTPDAGFRGVDTFKYGVHDNETNVEKKATVTITVGGTPPVAVANAYSTDAGTPLVIAAPGVRDNDTGSGNATQVGPAVNGSVTLAGDGGFTFTPVANFTGTASFQYKIVDLTASQDSGTVTVTITVNPVGPAPVANADSYTVSAGGTLNISAGDGVLDNDTNAATATLGTNVGHGVLNLSSNGSFTYVPTSGYDGPDSFTYTASGSGGTSSPATVSITVSPAEFDPGPTASITGTPRVGSTLTAHAGSPSPTPDSFAYQWFADGVPIGGATQETLTLTSGQSGKAITVKVTAVKAGITDASDVSDPTAKVSNLLAKHLELDTSSSTYAGNSLTVEVEKLAKNEPYTIRIDGTVVKTGTANSEGKVKTKVTVPLSIQPGTRSISVTGAFDDREDTDSLKVKAPSSLDVELDHSSVKKNRTQTVEVDNLLKGEKVEIRYDGNLITPSSAAGDSDGEYEFSFNVGSSTGTHTVKVTGTYNGRNSSKTFKVTN